MRKIIYIAFVMLSVCLHIAWGGTFYTADDVLSNSLINDIFQDSRNYIWIATEDGLNKYDGVRFTVYKNRTGDPATIKNNYVRLSGPVRKFMGRLVSERRIFSPKLHEYI